MLHLDVDHLCKVVGHKVVCQSLSQLKLMTTHRVKLANKDVSNWSKHIRKSVGCWSGGPVRSDNQTIFLLAVLLMWGDHVLVASRLKFLLGLL